MSKGKSGGVAIGGIMLATMLGVLVLAAAGWAGASYYYGEQRLLAHDQIMQSVAWSPRRVMRTDATADCDAGRMREESALRQGDISAFDLSKMVGFNQSASAARARGLQRTLKSLRHSNLAFMESYSCAMNSRMPRDGRELQLSGVISASAASVRSWIDPKAIPELLKVAWIGRDIQATEGLYEFDEGVQVMNIAYVTLADHLEGGRLDPFLDMTAATLDTLIQHEESAQLQWQVGARTLLASLYGDQWDQNPPTPMRARVMVETAPRLVEGLNAMPDVASKPYPERRAAMQAWLKVNDMTEWDSRFAGFGKAGLQVDARATRVHALGRALRIGIALRKHYNQRRRCPKTLEELVEGGAIATLPVDPIANAPFTYDPETCTLTSAEPPDMKPVVVHAFPYVEE